MADRFKRPSLRASLLALVAVLAGLLALLAWGTGALGGLEGQSLSARFSIRGSRGAPAEIVIVGPDATTFARYKERAPLRRAHYADLLDRLRSDGAKLVALDFSFGGETDPSDDNALRAAIRRNSPVLLGAELTADGGLRGPFDRASLPGAVLAPLPVSADRGTGVTRMFYAAYGHPTFAVRAAQLLGRSVSARELPGNRAWIDFRGPPFTFRSYALDAVVAGQVPRQALAGKVVMVGDLDSLDKDFTQTAAGYMPGIEVQANALATILDGFPLHGLSGFAVVLLLLALGALPALLSVRLPALLVLAATLLELIVFLALAQLAFNGGTIVPVPDPILALVLGTAGAIATDSFIARRQLRKLQQFFELLPSPVSDFFISYRRGPDAFVANTLRDQLAEKFGPKSVFLDNREIDAGAEFPSQIRDAVRACRAMLVVIGPDWLALRGADGERRLSAQADWVRLEIETALAAPDVRLVPVLYGGASMPSAKELPPTIQQLAVQNAVVLTGKNLDNEIDELVGSMERGRLRDFVRESA